MPTSGKNGRAGHDRTNSLRYNTLRSIQESDCANNGQVRNFKDVFGKTGRHSFLLLLYLWRPGPCHQVNNCVISSDWRQPFNIASVSICPWLWWLNYYNKSSQPWIQGLYVFFFFFLIQKLVKLSQRSLRVLRRDTQADFCLPKLKLNFQGEFRFKLSHAVLTPMMLFRSHRCFSSLLEPQSVGF